MRPRSRFTAKIARVVVLADGAKPEVRPRLAEVEAFLLERGLEVHLEADVRQFCTASENGGPQLAFGRPDLVVVLGGDGSVLTAVRSFGDDPVPVLGINYGRVGFLAPVEASAWRQGLLDALEGHATQELRMRLDVRTPDGRSFLALNDVVLARSPSTNMISLSLRADGDRVGDYRADGLILATPSGSTAYNLAAGGPILAPTMDGIVATPISAHTLSHRPLVLAPGADLRVEVLAGPAQVVVDGQPAGTLQVGESVHVRRAAYPYPLLLPDGMDPWKRLRDRLGWRGSLLSPGSDE
ncbi:MAG: NAD+ kinase [Planctomycetota bacterium]|jgi:NAD+ kinase